MLHYNFIYVYKTYVTLLHYNSGILKENYTKYWTYSLLKIDVDLRDYVLFLRLSKAIHRVIYAA